MQWTPDRSSKRWRDRPDLLAYLRAYAATPGRRLRRVERWRRRGWSRGKVAAAAESLAADLAANGIGAGDRVGIHLTDGPLWVAAFFGVLRCGAIAVPVDVAHPAELVVRLVDRLGLAAWITDPELPGLGPGVPCFEIDWRWKPDRRAAPSWPDPDPSRIAQVVLTSGTTDMPQMVEVSHRNLRSVLDALDTEIGRYAAAIRFGPRLRLAVALPFSHLYGQLMGVFLPVLLDADVTALAPMPGAELAAGLRRERARVCATVPRTLASLAGHLGREGRRRWGDDGLSARLRRADGRRWPFRWLMFDPLRRRLGRRLVAVVSGGAALDADLERFWRRLGYVVIQGYGLTEAAPLVTLNHPFRPTAGSIGGALPGVEVRLASDGEILVKGENVAAAGAGGAVDADGWLHTGDLGEMAVDGKIRFVGRKSERIVTPAGVNVDPAAIVSSLRERPEVVDAVVLERPWGEPGTVCAVLVVYPGADPARVVRRVNASLPDAARIRVWRVWPHGDLPRTPTGKPRRRDLVAWLRRAEGIPAAEGADGAEAVDEAEAVDRAEAVNKARPAEAGTESTAGTRSDELRRTLTLLSALVADDRTTAAGKGEQQGSMLSVPGRPGIREGEVTSARPSAAITAETPLAEALTSLDRVELAAELEELYGVSIGDASLAEDRTLAELAVELRRSAPGAGTTSATRAPRASAASQRTSPPADARGRPAAGRRDRSRGGPAQRVGARPESPGRRRSKRSPPEASWRYVAPARWARTALRELVMRPLAAATVRLEVSGRERVSNLEPPFLVAANHVSMMDPVVLFAMPSWLRARIAPAARWSYFTERRLGPLLYPLGALALNLFPLIQAGDWRPTLRFAGRLADRGYCVLIYPEGRISDDGRMRELQAGVALMSRELHLPILPCVTSGLHEALPRGTRWPRRAGWRRPVVTVRFGEPLEAVKPGQDLKAATVDLRTRMQDLAGR